MVLEYNYTLDSLILLPLRELTKSIAELIRAACMNKDIDHFLTTRDP